MSSFKAARLLAVTLAFASCSSAFCASRSAKPSLIDVPTAIAAWNVTPKPNETTASMEKRVRKELTKMLAADPDKLDMDSNHWRLLDYLGAYPWKQLPGKWKSWYLENQPNPRLTDEQREALIQSVKDLPTYKMTPKQVDVYLGWAQKQYPDLGQRVVHFARRNLNQPYKMYLLGEFPYEVYDEQPLFSLTNGDCVVFSEHSFAMALSHDWSEFFRNLQKLRYKDGQVGILSRNHYTEYDWDKNNSWLVRDVTSELGATTVTQYTEKINKASFFRRFGIGQDIAPTVLEDSYIPAEAIESVLGKLKDGSFVNIVRGRGNGVWVGHTGLIGHRPDGTVTFIHSTQPKAKEQPLMEYVKSNITQNPKREKKGEALFMGMKFLQLRDDVAGKQTASAPAAAK